MENYNYVNYELIGKYSNIARVTLNRPKSLNSMNTESINEIRSLLSRIESDNNIRCVILTGAGRAFCAGGDINEEAKTRVISGYAFSKNCGEMLDAIEHLHAPVIAAVNGYALGGGLEIALACDIRIASTAAKMGLPEIKLGVTTGWGGSQRLPRLISPSKAKLLLYTGDQVNAQEALEYGIVDKVVSPDELDASALELAEKIAGNAPLAMKYMKTAINEGLQSDLYGGLQIESGLFAQLYGTEDQIEAMNAFLEKRQAKPFQGK